MTGKVGPHNHTKSATYRLFDGGSVIVSYDPDAPCASCGLPVLSASVGGTAICPWCDMGKNRDGSPKRLEIDRVYFDAIDKRARWLWE